MKILITGATGLVGSRLTELLLDQSHTVRVFSRSNRKIPNIEVYQWDIDKEKIDESALDSVDAIIHLAGESVAAKRWSPDQKMKIISSRIDAAKILLDAVSKSQSKPSVFISASGISFYGIDSGEAVMTEEHPRGDGFLADVVDAWEASADQFSKQGIRTVKLRIGIVLAEGGGALEKMVPPVRFGIGSELGSGNQYMSWIHVDDLCKMIIHCMNQNNTSGTYNAVASNPVTNREMMRSIASTLGKPFFMPPVRNFVL